METEHLGKASEPLVDRLDKFPAGVRSRRWVLRDDNHQHRHGVVALSDRDAFIELWWTRDSHAPEQLVGRYRLHLEALLLHDYVRRDRSTGQRDGVRIRFHRGAGGVISLQRRSDAPALSVGHIESVVEMPAVDDGQGGRPAEARQDITDLRDAAELLSDFAGNQLGNRIGHLEMQFQGATRGTIRDLLTSVALSSQLLSAAYLLKAVAGQINVVIHALGILLALPRILENDERVEYLSLGAGNTGRRFDLETNKRVAEFKFINWRGGAEAIRQNALFKDFFLLAEHPTDKLKYLYVVGTEHPLRFLRGGRALSSVLSRNNQLWSDFRELYGDRFDRVSDYFAHRGHDVSIVDIRPLLQDAEDLLEPSNDDDNSEEEE